MFEQDYLVHLLLQFFRGLMRSHELRQEKDDPQAAADLLEGAIGSAVEMDGSTLLSLAPESIATVMQVSGIDPDVTQFVAREKAAIRAGQARAIAAEYGFELPDDPSDFDMLTEGLEEAALAGGFSKID